MKVKVALFIAAVAVVGVLVPGAKPAVAQTTSVFRFGVWADTKTGTGILNNDSKSMWTKSPKFLLYPGDVCSSGPDATCLATWKTAYNAGGDMLSISFLTRGNHDSAGTSTWTGYFNVANAATKIGATNLKQLSTNLTYSFDYGNSHFAFVDMPGGDATTISSAQLTWLDNDLTAAEARGVTHSFLSWHGPEYPMGGHCCTNAPTITSVLNKHPSVSATFHGHEHNLAYAHIDSTKISNVTHPYEEFTSGGGGADLYGCQRGDWCQSTTGYMTVDVNGGSFVVTAFNSSGSTLKSWAFNKSSTGPTNTPVPTAKPSSTPVPTVRPTTTPIPGVTSTPVPSPRPTVAPSVTPVPGTDYQPAFPVRAAFYYPWFPEAWTQLGHYPYTKFHPTLGFYSAYDAATIKTHIGMMQYGKIQAGIASWWGQGQQTDTKVPGLLRAADGTNFRWALYYENESQGDPTVSQIQNDINYIDTKYAHDANYWRIGGRPVLFVYADAADACGMADRWKQGNTKNFYVVLKVFAGYANCASQPANWHQYSPAVAEDSQPGHSFAIAPSFDKYGEATRLARDINRWTTNVAHMRASNAPLQLVTTFNEWGEGTSVEPATEWSSNSGYGLYLDALHNDGAVVPTVTAAPPTSTPRPTVTPTVFNGDANHDGHVNDADLTIWLAHYNQSTVNKETDGDFDKNGKVDGVDYVIWLTTFTG